MLLQCRLMYGAQESLLAIAFSGKLLTAPCCGAAAAGAAAAPTGELTKHSLRMYTCTLDMGINCRLYMKEQGTFVHAACSSSASAGGQTVMATRTCEHQAFRQQGISATAGQLQAARHGVSVKRASAPPVELQQIDLTTIHASVVHHACAPTVRFA